MQADIRLADLCTQAAREAALLCESKGLQLLFDYVGQDARAAADADTLQAALRRLYGAAAEILREGFVLFTARCDARPAGGTDFTAVAAASGRFVDARTQAALIARLQLQGEQQVTDTDLAAPAARGSCPLTGGQLRFALHPQEGALFSLELPLPAGQVLPADLPDAAGARAWLLREDCVADDGVERRLQRLGWAVRRFASVEDAVREAEALSPGQSRPALVLAYEGPRVSLPALRSLWALLPASSELVLAVPPRSPWLATRSSGPIGVRARPLAPDELVQFTQRAAGAEEPSGLTQPAPLAFEHRRRALVVDDNEVNLMVASGMLQVLGFEVDTATDGSQAIALCLQTAPDLVLMDLHMPGMDGLEATRRLRLLQREGAMPRFLIVAATADVSAEEACTQAGMDAHLPKPLNLAGLENQLRRLMPALQ